VHYARASLLVGRLLCVRELSIPAPTINRSLDGKLVTRPWWHLTVCVWSRDDESVSSFCFPMEQETSRVWQTICMGGALLMLFLTSADRLWIAIPCRRCGWSLNCANELKSGHTSVWRLLRQAKRPKCSGYVLRDQLDTFFASKCKNPFTHRTTSATAYGPRDLRGPGHYDNF